MICKFSTLPYNKKLKTKQYKSFNNLHLYHKQNNTND